MKANISDELRTAELSFERDQLQTIIATPRPHTRPSSTQGWMMYTVIFLNVLGYTITASLQSIISGAADPQSQGQALGAVNSLNSLMAVLAPLFGAPLLAMV